MSQSKQRSIIEAVTTVALGYGVSLAAQIIIFPHFGVYVPISTNLQMSAVFTLISLIRQYVVRRIFNKWHT